MRAHLSKFDRLTMAFAPKWTAERVIARTRLEAFAGFSSDGYGVPGSPKKALKGITARANSPDSDINAKLDGIRALSRDLVMNSPLAASIIRRHRSTVINAGLQLQARVDGAELGLSEDETQAAEKQIEKEFDLWAASLFCDYDESLTFGELQGVAFVNTLLSGDVFFVMPFDPPQDKFFPYSTRVKLIDADLVRDPAVKGTADIQGGVEKNGKGRVTAVHVWNSYPHEYGFASVAKIPQSMRVPMYNENGERQVFQIADFERVGQRRGVSLLAPAFEPLKQLTRLSEAQLMNALVSSLFSVFVKSTGSVQSTLGEALTPEETLFGGGRYGPNSAPESEKLDSAANDLEMGHGNVTYLDENTDVTVADPRKIDTGFQVFWEALGTQVAAVGGVPFETAMMKYTTSYTAARAAMIDAWKNVTVWRAIMVRRFCNICYEGFFTEAVLRGRITAPGYFDDIRIRRAWTGSYWVGVGQGALNPLQEAKAAETNLKNLSTTYEEEYLERKGGRWDDAMVKRARENRLLKELGIVEEEPVIEEPEMPVIDEPEPIEEGEDIEN